MGFDIQHTLTRGPQAGAGPVAKYDPPFLPVSATWRLKDGYCCGDGSHGAEVPDWIGRQQIRLQTAADGCSVIHVSGDIVHSMHHECLFVEPVLNLRVRFAGSAQFSVHGRKSMAEDKRNYFIESVTAGGVVTAEHTAGYGEQMCVLLSRERLSHMLDGVAVPDSLSKLLRGERPGLMPALSPSIRRQFATLLANPYTGASSRLYLSAKLLEIVATVLDDLSDTGPMDERRLGLERAKVTRVCDLLRARLNDPPSSDELAREVGLSQRRLWQAFRSVTGMTIMEWLQEQKLLQARHWLSTEGISIKELCHRLGYSHRSTFTHAFTQRFGCPPAAYRIAAGGAGSY